MPILLPLSGTTQKELNMRKIILIGLLMVVVAFGNTPSRLAHTYSIVAYDSVSGQLGVAVQSHWFSVGKDVIWAEPGVGAVATQSFINPSFGPLGLDLMRRGKSATEALDALIYSDSGRDVRQVAMVDVQGNVAVHTGKKCIKDAGHKVGKHYSVQANLMLKNTVWDAMSEAYESTQGDLLARLMAALKAAEAEGGDIRGKQSAAILIVPAKKSGKEWQDKIVDLRIEDHPTPIKELERLVKVHRAYSFMTLGDDYLAEKRTKEALEAYSKAYNLYPENIEILFWKAVTMVDINQLDAALPLFKRVFKRDKIWAEVVRRLPASGLLPNDTKILDKILKQAE